jgi:hypothetical protein
MFPQPTRRTLSNTWAMEFLKPFVLNPREWSQCSQWP